MIQRRERFFGRTISCETTVMQDYVSARLLIIFLWFFSGKLFSSRHLKPYFKCFQLQCPAERTCGQIITNFVVPSTAFEGDSVYIICDYSLIKGQKLYTLKWYKEEQEFWRYEPRNRPKFQALNVTGISIEVSLSSCSNMFVWLQKCLLTHKLGDN